MEFRNAEQDYVTEALTLALREYSMECTKCPQLMQTNFKTELREILKELFSSKYGKVAVENGKVIGYLVFSGPWDGFFGNAKGVYSPLGGSAFAGGNRNKLASKLLEAVAADIIADGVSSLALTRYAHDEEVGNSFIMNGFGIRCSDAVMKLNPRNKISDINGTITFKELIKEGKREITGLYRELIRHLSAAPIFFPMDLSRTEHWFLEDGIRVIAALEKGKIIGYMAFTGSGETFISECRNMYNICGAYVEKEYRNQGIAQQLLEYICGISEEEGMEYLGVDCETLNPTALRFWGKYFDNYTYSYARRIDERIIGYDEYLKKEWINK